MHSRRETTKYFTPTKTIPNNKNYSNCVENSRITPDRSSSGRSSTLNSTQNLHIKRGESEHSLTSIIEEKVSSLKSKFGELNGLRKKLIGSCANNVTNNTLSSTSRARIKSFDTIKNARTPELFTERMFQSEDNRTKPILKKEETPEREMKKNQNTSNFDNILFEAEHGKIKPESISNSTNILKLEIENLKKQLQIIQNELKESEKTRNQLSLVVKKQEEDIKNYSEKYRKIIENNKGLKLQFNRLENQLKAVDTKKATNTNAIRNLSYIILSKDNPGRESPSKQENTNNNSILLKYLEALNELHSSDQFTLSVLEQVNKNKFKDASKMLTDVQEMLLDRLERTRKNVDELENIVYECKSPLLQIKGSQLDVKEENSQKNIEERDYISFLKCEASMIEELLIMT